MPKSVVLSQDRNWGDHLFTKTLGTKNLDPPHLFEVSIDYFPKYYAQNIAIGILHPLLVKKHCIVCGAHR